MAREVDLLNERAQLRPINLIDGSGAVEQFAEFISERERARGIVDAVFGFVAPANERSELQAALKLVDRGRQILIAGVGAPHVGIFVLMRIAQRPDRRQERSTAEPLGERVNQATRGAAVRQKHKRIGERERIIGAPQRLDHRLGEQIQKWR